MSKGILYLIPVVIGDGLPHLYLPAGTLEIIKRIKVIIAENARTARRFIKLCEPMHPLQEIDVHELDKHSKNPEIDKLFFSLRNGIDTGLMSEAGMPGIADPGGEIVLAAHKEGIKVVALTGPSSIFLALASSGLNGQQFSFNGYIPKEKAERINRIKELETKVRKSGYTQIFIETPYRNTAIYQELLNTLSNDINLCVASGICSENEFIKTQKIAEWKKKSMPPIDKIPAVFLIG